MHTPTDGLLVKSSLLTNFSNARLQHSLSEVFHLCLDAFTHLFNETTRGQALLTCDNASHNKAINRVTLRKDQCMIAE
jgi:hypothetical protein